MKACQGHVRTDTRPEQINRTVSFSPHRRTGGKKENGVSEEKSYRGLKGRKANSTRPRVCLACNCLPPTERVSNTLCWLGLDGRSWGAGAVRRAQPERGRKQRGITTNRDPRCSAARTGIQRDQVSWFRSKGRWRRQKYVRGKSRQEIKKRQLMSVGNSGDKVHMQTQRRTLVFCNIEWRCAASIWYLLE